MTKEELFYSSIIFLIIGMISHVISYILMTDYNIGMILGYGLCAVCITAYIYRVIQQEWIKNRRIN